MMWDEFLTKLSEAKKLKIPLGFNSGVLARLIFSGAFNSMIAGNQEYMSMQAWKRYVRMTGEAFKAINSKSQLPKALKGDPVGISDIRSDSALVLWRRSTNPLFSCNLVGLYPKHLQEVFGFVPNERGNINKIPMVKEAPPGSGKHSYDLYSAWDFVFHGHSSMASYQKDLRRAAVMGVIVKASPRAYGSGKKCFDVTFFDGYHEYDIVLWPPFGKNEYNLAIASEIKPCDFGVLVIKPSTWKGKQGGNLIKFYRMDT